MALQKNFLRLVPIAVFLCTSQIGSMVAVQILENTVLVL